MRRHTSCFAGILCCVGFALLPAAARAQDEDDGRDWTVTIGAGAVQAPDYEGSDDFQTLPFPFVAVDYRGIAYVRGTELGANVKVPLADAMVLKIGPMARFRRDRPESRNRDLKGLGDVGTGIEVGGALRMEVSRGWAQVSLAKDVLDAHKGAVGVVEAGWAFDLAPRLSASVAASSTWADQDYMRTYFSVDALQSARSGLPRFAAGSGLKDAGANLGLQYRLGDHWMVAGSAGYTRLFGDAADAPLVRLRGSPDQWQGALFLAYRF